MYYNDKHRTSFVSYNNYLLACNKTHESSSETEPVILYDGNTAKGVENIAEKTANVVTKTSENNNIIKSCMESLSTFKTIVDSFKLE